MRAKLPTVGLFDSGIGGLSVLSACVRLVPNARYLYLGDNGNAPYGEKSEEQIYRLVERGVRRLKRAGADVVVLACNTATAVAIDCLRENFNFPIVGTEPALACAAQRCKSVVILSTPRTAKSERLRLLVERYPSVECRIVSCPRLAWEIERTAGYAPISRLRADLPRVECDGVVLGCTHYSFVKKQIGDFYRAPVFDGAEGVAHRVKGLLEEKFGEVQGALTTWTYISGINDHSQKTNKSSCIFGKKDKISPKNDIFFLGKWKKYNKLRHEQMFFFQ